MLCFMLVDKSSKNKEKKEKFITETLFLELLSLQGNDTNPNPNPVTSSKSCDIEHICLRFERSSSNNVSVRDTK